MAQLPQIAWLRLHQTSTASAHPDPGMLAAFVEHALPANRREMVLDHLAGCAVCREVVVLATPDAMAVPDHASRFRPSGFWTALRWAPLRWAGVAATAAVVATAIWMGRVEESIPAQTTAVVRTDAPAARASETPQGTPSEIAAAPKTVAPAMKSPVRSAPPAARFSAQEIAASSPAPSTQPHTPTVASGQPAQSQPATVASNSSQASTSSVTPSGTPVWATSTAPAAATAANHRPALAPPAPVWSVADGGLRKSIDRGRTWQPIAVDESAVLKSVSALGDRIWVGGSAGVLYRSEDAGQSWTRVVPVLEGAALADDIVWLKFEGQKGWLATSTGMRWITVDGGATWSVHQGPKL